MSDFARHGGRLLPEILQQADQRRLIQINAAHQADSVSIVTAVECAPV